MASTIEKVNNRKRTKNARRGMPRKSALEGLIEKVAIQQSLSWKRVRTLVFW